MGPPQPRGGCIAVLAVAAVAGCAYAIGLGGPGFFDNEGRYVEVARQMNLRGDFVTPFMNGIPFLNKPPLAFWLVAPLLRVLDEPECARVVAVAAAVATLVATARLGAHLYDLRHGLASAVLLGTMVGFVLEARTLRPDGLVVASIAWALLCFRHADEGGPRRTAWLAGFYAALGLGVLAKGFVVPALLAPAVAVVACGRHGWRGGLRALRPGLGIAVLAAIVLPWHVLAALRNPGFAWDFVVNQHLLFAFDVKEPRDSEGDPLVPFLGAFLGRAAPWVVLLPLAVRRARSATGDPWILVPWVWMATPLVLFALTPSRLEHYTLPALPAVALLAARPALDLAAGRDAWARGAATAMGLAALAAGIVLALAGSTVLEPLYWIAQAPALAPLPRLAGLVLAGGGALVLGAAFLRRCRAALAALFAMTCAFDVIVVAALAAVTPLFSWQPVARAIDAAFPRGVEVVFEAPIEYQLVGGLDFYLARDVTLLEPVAGFVPPTYLEAYAERMFVSREDFVRRWRQPRPLVFVSDPTRRRDGPEGLVPPPYTVVARFGDRWVLENDGAAR